ncbi:hypothetical protein [Aliikangiella sp. G2MR2-5]|uniref:hypothetical protein n=1 Tax=Aliikangiella sp. G2MR2-5 TaxID=2788943 RepID=UPI001AEDD090|nr:hypothetical protein [Aliikangiella sp. G2MR2-5]
MYKFLLSLFFVIASTCLYLFTNGKSPDPIPLDRENFSAKDPNISNIAKQTSDKNLPNFKSELELVIKEKQLGNQIKLDNQAIASLARSINVPPADLPQLSGSFTNNRASKQQIADHELYAQYEQESRIQLKRSYIIAAREKVAELDRFIELGKQRGIEQSLINEAVQKREGIKKLALKFEKELK